MTPGNLIAGLAAAAYVAFVMWGLVQILLGHWDDDEDVDVVLHALQGNDHLELAVMVGLDAEISPPAERRHW